ncbi:MlaE family ABC transporter permease [Mycolicibacterium parafortuitum]|uniref:ABC-type transport system involved in resistance to organic solvents, permease component [Gordonia sp. KTR9] n=1 Tax=Mycolicibacterium parafortuitum TaxID=39692 RepID=A0A375YIK0_MYCPF|nr:ABC transporter permease [Mycolicibacterium parafortuitum]ORB32269.1 ABC transporter [Mycolicibacterium parafortuitum]SRX80952.1 ABC-type transport system involved in resistance to organic solvents, permease component [Gordonia sp. KTR9] [Mycolicibacterium parafortuitum]
MTRHEATQRHESVISPVGEITQWTRGYVDRHPRAALETVGSQCLLGLRALRYLIVDIAAGRFPFREFVQQAAFMASTAMLPTMCVAIPIGVTLQIQFALLAGQVGATSLAGAASGMAVIRQGAPLVAALLMASAVGSAICADLGSRTIRDEVDALEVMGISAIRRLVVPRLAAAVVVGVSLTGLVCFIGFLAGYLFNTFAQDGAPGSFVSTFASFATVGDLVLTLIKAVVFAAIVVIVACDKGLTTQGGPAGVANSVNATVVASIVLLMITNVVFTQMYVLLFPKAAL